jgi:hypothetical protein
LKLVFHREIEELKGISNDAYDYLAKIDQTSWSMAWFNTFPKCDLLVNNIRECFNSYVLKARDQPIISMLETIRKKLMNRYQTKQDGIRTMTIMICPRIVAKLEEIGEEVSHCYSTYAENGLFEVTYKTKQYVVYMLFGLIMQTLRIM